jgi:HK97 family phage prohead protease
MSQSLIHRMIDSRVSVDSDDRTMEFVMSTETKDAHGTVLKQDWDLKRYRKNPVFMWAHDSNELPIGRVIEVGVKDGQLQGKVEFAPAEINPKAEQVYQAYKAKFLKGVSVGFRSHDIRVEKHDDVKVPILAKNELYELSGAPIPSNPDTLAKMLERMFPTANASGDNNEVDNMELKELEARLAKVDQELTDERATVLEERAKVGALEKRIESLESSRKELEERALAAEKRLIERDVEGLVGKKITKPEADALIELYSVSPEMYTKHLELAQARNDMNIVADGSVMGNDPTPQGGEDLTSRIAAR